MKVVINGRYGGFGLSDIGHYELGRRLGLTTEQSNMVYAVCRPDESFTCHVVTSF